MEECIGESVYSIRMGAARTGFIRGERGNNKGLEQRPWGVRRGVGGAEMVYGSGKTGAKEGSVSSEVTRNYHRPRFGTAMDGTSP